MITKSIAILFKDNYLSFVTIIHNEFGGEVLKIIYPYEPLVLQYNSTFEAKAEYDDTILDCIDDGWDLVHNGSPNYG